MPNDRKLEIYKMFVDSSFRVTEMRAKINTFYVTLNAALIGSNVLLESSAILLFGMLVNYLWVQSIKSSKCLNKAKFEIIHKMEKDMPYKCFFEENKICHDDKRKNFTNIEQKIPYFLMICYLYLFLENNHFVVSKLVDYIACVCL